MRNMLVGSDISFRYSIPVTVFEGGTELEGAVYVEEWPEITSNIASQPSDVERIIGPLIKAKQFVEQQYPVNVNVQLEAGPDDGRGSVKGFEFGVYMEMRYPSSPEKYLEDSLRSFITIVPFKPLRPGGKADLVGIVKEHEPMTMSTLEPLLKNRR